MTPMGVGISRLNLDAFLGELPAPPRIDVGTAQKSRAGLLLVECSRLVLAGGQCAPGASLNALDLHRRGAGQPQVAFQPGLAYSGLCALQLLAGRGTLIALHLLYGAKLRHL